MKGDLKLMLAVNWIRRKAFSLSILSKGPNIWSPFAELYVCKAVCSWWKLVKKNKKKTVKILQTFKFITILVFIISCLLFPTVRTYLSVYGRQRGWGGGVQWESNYGLRLPDWQQIIFMSPQEDRKRPAIFLWLPLWKRPKPTQSSPAAGNSSIARTGRPHKYPQRTNRSKTIKCRQFSCCSFHWTSVPGLVVAMYNYRWP